MRQLMTLLVTICAVVAAAPVSAQGGFCPQIEIVDAATGIAADTFTQRVVDLQIFVDVIPDPTGIHSTAIELVTPNRRRYRVLSCTLGADTADPSCTVVPRAKSLETSKINATWDATFTLPVVGTDIPLNGLWGTWQIRPTFDGVPPDCPDTYSFTLVQPMPSDLFSDGFESGSTTAWSSIGS